MSIATLARAPTFPADPLIGSVLAGKYLIKRRLAESHFAVVYLGESVAWKPVIVKRPSPAVLADPDSLARFFREVQAGNRVDHERAVGVIDHDVEPPYLVQPFIRGVDGLAWLGRLGGRTSPAAALWLANQVLSVLVCAHARGIIHRDIKLENIIVTDEAAYVIDWGIAHIAGERRLTVQGVPMGTPGYMPPEACEGRWDDLGPSADTFAVGALLFEALTGQLPWQGGTSLAILAATSADPAPPLRALRPDVPTAVAAIVDRALAHDRRDRYPTAADMLADVRAA